MVVGWILAAVAAGGCRGGRGDASASDAARVQVASIELGREVGPDKRVAAPSASFAAGDTVYASVVTRGKAPLATLTARWRRQGELLNESTQMIAPQGETASEFHVWKPQGWPPGEGYEVEILLDGETAGRRPFSVH
jgi:hypothetical protein